MRFEWDENKERVNLAKHAVSFKLAEKVWNDPHVWTYFDRFEEGEARYHAVGVVAGLTILTVVHTYRDANGQEVIRIIGARRATRHEKSAYENG